MPKREVAATALFVAAVRARESRRPSPLFRDDLSAALAGPEGLARLKASETDPVSNYRESNFPYLEVRTRYFDDWVLAAARGSRAKQVVILGAGMDARAFRLSWPGGTRLWEIDTEDLFSLKEVRLRSASARPLCERIVVEEDLLSDRWVAHLLRSGLDENLPTVWLAEGLLEYLPPRVVDQTLDCAASLSPAGSYLGAEIVSQEYIDGRSNRQLVQRRRERGTPFTFGTDEPEKLLLAHGWKVEKAVSPLDVAMSLGRWAPRKDGTKPPGASFVTAIRQ